MYHVSILLTALPSTSSTMFRILTGGRYSHASIGVTDEELEFFSFAGKGFRREAPSPRKYGTRCALYRFPVSEDTHQHVSKLLQQFTEKKTEYRYSNWGLFLCMLRIRHEMKQQYFCSRFVATVLNTCKEIELKKHPSLYFPDDFRKEPQLTLYFEGTLGELKERVRS